MSQRPLTIHVEEPETGASRDYTFEAGPVIVGRGDTVSLQLARPFVSMHHGTFEFDDQRVTYADLDSRNGTLIDGQRPAGDRPVPVTESTDIRIGKLRLRVSRMVAPKPAEEAVDPFAARPTAKMSNKGTDALPREDVERIRREMVERKQPPLAPPAPAPVAPRPAFVPPKYVAPSAPPPAEPSTLEKTMPVPELQSQPAGTPITRETGPRPAAPYVAGGTTAVPMLPREAPVRRTSRPKIPVSPAPRRAPQRRVASGRNWWPFVVLGIVAMMGLVVFLLVTADEGEERRQRPDAGRTRGVIPEEKFDAAEWPAPPDAAPEWVPPDPPRPRPDARRRTHGSVVDPPRPPPPQSKKSAPILP